MLDYQVLSRAVNEKGQHVQPRPARRRLPRARRPLRRRLPQGRAPARRHRPRGVCAPARARRARTTGPGRASAALVVAVSVGHDRSTFAVSDGRICEFTRVLEWGGWSLERRDRPRARHVAVARPSRSSGRSRFDRVDASVPRASAQEQSRPRARPPDGSSRRSRGSSSPRSSSTRTSPARWASARSCSPAAPRICPASPRSSSG